jgi:hypothetical protein
MSMRIPKIVIVVGSALLSAACGSMLPTFPKQLVDGCYYANGKPVFTVDDADGVVLIPGEVQTFKIERGGSPYRAWAKFSPAFTFDGDDAQGRPATVGAYADREPFTFYMKPRTDVPTLQMFWGAYGFQDVQLGRPCRSTPPR